MARKATFDETKALILYQALKSDSEIAKELGVMTSTIRGWRQRNHLKVIYQRPSKKVKPRSDYKVGCDYRVALDHGQAIEMNRFLHSISWVANKAKEAGSKPNVNLFIKAWRGDPVTEEDKKESKKAYWREHDRIKRAKAKRGKTDC